MVDDTDFTPRLGKLRESVDTLKQENAEISRVLGSGEPADGGAP